MVRATGLEPSTATHRREAEIRPPRCVAEWRSAPFGAIPRSQSSAPKTAHGYAAGCFWYGRQDLNRARRRIGGKRKSDLRVASLNGAPRHSVRFCVAGGECLCCSGAFAFRGFFTAPLELLRIYQRHNRLFLLRCGRFQLSV